MKKKIMLIDDDRDFADACENLLDAAGYEVICLNTEVMAVVAIFSFMPDLVILDVMIETETGGFTIADRICEHDSLRLIPVIFLTGYFKKGIFTGKEDEKIKRWANVKAVLDKPVRPMMLLDTIRGLV